MKTLVNLPSFYGVIDVKKSVSGKIRLQVEKIKNNQKLVDELKKNLEKISAINDFKILPSLGIITINYDEKQIDQNFMYGILLNLLDLEEEIFKRKPSKIKGIIQDGCEMLDITLYNKSRGLLDIKTLTGILFIGYGLKKMRVNTTTNIGVGFLWWAYNLLKDDI